MKFDSLKEKCNYYRSLTDYKLMPNSYVLVMLDGRSFSKIIKKKFKRPFDINFINLMNETAKYICENVQGAKLAFVQSDEISIVLTDFDTPETDSFFGYRLCKLLSIISSLGTGFFNKHVSSDISLAQFDCKAWNVPTFNDVYAWFLYRQLDCIKNSKQQVAQEYLSHKELLGMTADDQIQLLKDQEKVNWWTDFSNGEKFGRFIWKESRQFTRENGEEYSRNIWTIKEAFELFSQEGKDTFFNLGVIPKL